MVFEDIGAWDVLTIFAILFVLYAFAYPQYQIKKVKVQRLSMIKKMEQEWGTRVLTLIHRKEAVSMFGLPVYQYIDIEDAESILRGIRDTKEERPIDIIIHTPGGQVHPSIQIARALKNHRGHTRVMIPHYSMSGGTIIALAADEIIMDDDAVIGPIDPQIGDLIRGTYPAPSWIYAASKKGDKADDTTIVISDISEKTMKLMRKVTTELLDGKIEDEDKLNYAVEKLVSGEMVHITPISASEAIDIGLPVSTDLSNKVHEFMKFYRSVKSSVEYTE